MRGRRTARTGLACILLSAAAAACGHGSAVTKAPTTGAAKGAAAPSPTTRAPDLSAVPRPAGLDVVVRLTHPESSMKTAAQLAGDTFPVLRSLTAKGLVAGFLGDPLADVVDPAQPIDLAMRTAAGGTKDTLAVSLAVPRLDEALANLREDYRVTTTESGAIALAPLDAATEHVLRACEIRPAFGEAAHRLICAKDAATLAAFAPFLARTATRATTTDDLMLSFDPARQLTELRVAPPKPGESASSQQGRQLGFDLFRGLLGDSRTISLLAQLDPNAAEVVLGADLRAATSPVSSMLVALAGDGKPLPDAFWRLPADSDFALYTRGVARSDYGSLRDLAFKTIREGIRADAEPEVEMPPEIVDRIMHVFESTLMTGGPILFAHGFDVEAARAKLNGAAPRTAAEDAAEWKALSGWGLVRLDEPSARWIDAAHEVIALEKISLPKKKRAAGAAGADAAAGDAKPKKNTSTSKLVEVPLAASARLPAGAMHLEIVETPLAKGKAAPVDGEAEDAEAARAPRATHVTHVYVVPDGEHTWIAFGADDAAITARLRAELDPSTRARTLAERPGLEPLRKESTTLAGFATTAGFAALDLTGTPPHGKARRSAREAIEAVHAIPNGGGAPIPFYTVGMANGQGGVVMLRVRLTRAALGEIAARAGD